MADPNPASASLGFLTVCEHEGGLFGGYLVLNLSGRPLEFHCTAPVRPSRTQAILYGPTLKPYLYGEQIGQALLEKAKSPPLIVFTDVQPALTVRNFIAWPVAYVPPADDDALSAATPPADSSLRWDAAHPSPPGPPPCGCTASRPARSCSACPPTTPRTKRRSANAGGRTRPSSICANRSTRIREAIDEARRACVEPEGFEP